MVTVFQCAFAFLILCLFPLPCHAILRKKDVATVGQATGAHERQEREEEEEAGEDTLRLEMPVKLKMGRGCCKHLAWCSVTLCALQLK